jgi:hypothetical protein
MSRKARPFRKFFGDPPSGPRNCWRVNSAMRATPNSLECDVCGRVPDTLHTALRGPGKWCPEHCPHCQVPEAA